MPAEHQPLRKRIAACLALPEVTQLNWRKINDGQLNFAIFSNSNGIIFNRCVC